MSVESPLPLALHAPLSRKEKEFLGRNNLELNWLFDEDKIVEVNALTYSYTPQCRIYHTYAENKGSFRLYRSWRCEFYLTVPL